MDGSLAQRSYAVFVTFATQSLRAGSKRLCDISSPASAVGADQRAAGDDQKRTEGEMAPEIPIDRQRPAEYVFSRHVEEAIARLESRGQPAESVGGSG